VTWALLGFAAGVGLPVVLRRYWPRCGFQWNIDGYCGPHACIRRRWHLSSHRCSEGGAVVIERPILFSAPMVRAVRADTKRQTRRIVKGAPADAVLARRVAMMPPSPNRIESWMFTRRDNTGAMVPCPYGAAGDRLWVQEGYRLDHPDGLAHAVEHAAARREGLAVTCVYLADEATRTVQLGADEVQLLRARKTDPRKAQPGRFMYGSCSRDSLAVESVRAEHLHDISEEDARAEGVAPLVYNFDGQRKVSYRDSFELLWCLINGRASWEANPWVWVIGFSRVAPAARAA